MRSTVERSKHEPRVKTLVIIGWVIAPFALLAAIVLWVMALIPSGRISFQCQACKQWFTIAKSEIPTRR